MLAPFPRLVAAGLLAAICAVFAHAAPPLAGSVKNAQGGSVVRRGSETLPVQPGMHLFAGDVLQTAAGGRLGVLLQDGTRLSLGPSTELELDQFVYEPANGKFALALRLVRGILAYVSGKIAQLSPGAASVETPVGIVGLRGTHFAVSIEGVEGARP